MIPKEATQRAYELGVQRALQDLGLVKQANRLRQLVRSGQLAWSPEVGQAFKQLGYTTSREAKGLNRGSFAIAKQHGIPVRKVDTNKADAGQFFRANINENPLAQFDRKLISDELVAAQGGGAATLTGRGVVYDPKLPILSAAAEGMGAGKGRSFAKNKRAHSALILRHEIDEARAMQRLGIDVTKAPQTLQDLINLKRKESFRGRSPQELRDILASGSIREVATSGARSKGGVQFSHMHPEVIAKHVENARMFTPRIDRFWNQMHGKERELLREQLGAPIRTQYGWRKKLEPLAAKYQNQSDVIGQHMLDLAEGRAPIKRSLPETEGLKPAWSTPNLSRLPMHPSSVFPAPFWGKNKP